MQLFRAVELVLLVEEVKTGFAFGASIRDSQDDNIDNVTYIFFICSLRSM